MATAYDHLISPCSETSCHNPACPHVAAQEAASGRWFITMGHCNFNSTANNRNGYATRAVAEKASLALLLKARPAEPEGAGTLYRQPDGLVWMGLA